MISYSQRQVGQTLTGDQLFDAFGYTVDMSRSGDTIAVGAPFASPDINNSGIVRVYVFDGSEWSQLGEDIEGFVEDDRVGTSIALSKGGRRVAVAHSDIDKTAFVRILEWDSGEWVEIGDITSRGVDDAFGYALDFSGDGRVLAIGAPEHAQGGEQRGRVEAYVYDGKKWELIDEAYVGFRLSSRFGHKVQLNHDGTLLSLTDPLGGNLQGGRFDMLKIDNGRWRPWTAIVPSKLGEDFGDSFSITPDTQFVAFTAPNADQFGENRGLVRVYKYTINAFRPMGFEIVGPQLNGFLGGSGTPFRDESIALSADGSVLAVGSARGGSDGIETGLVQFYSFDGNDWRPNMKVIYGDAEGDQFGSALAISEDGKRIVIGGRFNDDNGEDAGHVKVYDCENMTKVTDTPDETIFSIRPNPARDVIELQFNNEIIMSSDGKIDLVDAYGKSIVSERLNGSPTQSIDVSSLPSGTYLVRISDGGNAFSKRLVIRR